MENQTIKEGKTAAIISHFWVIGLIIAFILSNSKKNSFASFYIRQMIGINLLIMIDKYIVHQFIGTTASWLLGVIIFVLWVISLVSAVKGEEKVVPVIGNNFQDWFKNI
jgi:uncharacterized membrane protein